MKKMKKILFLGLVMLIMLVTLLVTSCPNPNTPEPDEVTQYMGPLFFATGNHGSNYYFENVTDGWQRWPVYSAQIHYDAVSFNMGTFDRVMIVGVYGDGWIYDDKIVPNDPGASWKAAGQSGGIYQGVAYGNGTLVAVGYDGETHWRGKIVYSDDWGSTWYDAYLDTGNGTQLWDVEYGNGIFVAVGRKVLYSSDGENWTESPFAPLAHLRGVAYGNGWFVAVGSVYTPLTGGGGSAVTYATQDGFTWFIGSSGTTNILNDVAYDPIQNRFIAVGWYGTILYTTNLGSSWTAVSSGTSSNLNTIAFGNGMLMVGGSNSVAGGDIDTCYSTDHGITWTVIHNSPGVINGICWKP